MALHPARELVEPRPVQEGPGEAEHARTIRRRAKARPVGHARSSGCASRCRWGLPKPKPSQMRCALIDSYIYVLTGFGALVLLTAWLPLVLKELPLSRGQEHRFEVLYSALGLRLRSDLAIALGAKHPRPAGSSPTTTIVPR